MKQKSTIATIHEFDLEGMKAANRAVISAKEALLDAEAEVARFQYHLANIALHSDFYSGLSAKTKEVIGRAIFLDVV